MWKFSPAVMLAAAILCSAAAPRIVAAQTTNPTADPPVATTAPTGEPAANIAPAEAPRLEPPATTPPATIRPAKSPSVTTPPTPKLLAPEGRRPSTGAAVDTTDEPRESWQPELSGATLGWFAAIVILTLTFRLHPRLSLRNLDAVVLAILAIAMSMRADNTPLGISPNSWTLQQLSFAVLGLGAAYFALRGAALLFTRTIPRLEPSLAPSAMFVLLIAGLAICVQQIATAPLSQGSRDALIGGIVLNETGKLPYGDAAPNDANGPLVYLAHAGALRVLPLEFDTPDTDAVRANWSNREQWLSADWSQSTRGSAARLANAVVFVLFLLGVYAVSTRLHSPAFGLQAVILLCVFPGVIECLARPEIMMPAMLLTWAAYAALLSGFASFLAMILVIFAGLSWGWGFLAVPVLLLHFFRRGALSALGAILGAGGGIALAVYALLALVQPSLPRADGLLALEGVHATHAAVRSADGDIVIGTSNASTTPSTSIRGLIWRFVAAQDTTIVPAPIENVHVNGDVTPGQVHFSRLSASGEAREQLTRIYRQQVAIVGGSASTWAVIRTFGEALWHRPTPQAAAVPSAWTLWFGPETPTTRERICCLFPLLSIILVLGLGLLLVVRDRTRPHHLIGALLFITAIAWLAHRSGVGADSIWIMPFVLALWAINAESIGGTIRREPSPALNPNPRPKAPLPPIKMGPTPRITVET